MTLSTRVVPMPHWSTAVGCTKLALSIIILAFIAACTAIWGGYPAFGFSLFTASFSLLAFSYYLTALSFEPAFYNKWIVLLLESLLTLFWLSSFILLAGWTAATASVPSWVWNAPVYPISPVAIAVDSIRRDIDVDVFSLYSSPLETMKRHTTGTSRTQIRVHGQDAHDAARVLAGTSCGLAAIVFILYAVTLAVFSINFTKDNITTPSNIDEEARTSSIIHLGENIQRGPLMPPAISAPLRVDTLPKDFEPKPQTQKHYLTPEDAAKAGIEPPTPVLKAQMAQKERERATKGTDQEEAARQLDDAVDTDPVSPLEEVKEK